MAQNIQPPQADTLWESQDHTARFYFTLQPHGAGLGDEYSRFVAEGHEYTALPKIEPVTWERVCGHVKTFMARLDPSVGRGYSIDLRVPRDVNDPSLPVGTCRFGCGTSEAKLRQASISALSHTVRHNIARNTKMCAEPRTCLCL